MNLPARSGSTGFQVPPSTLRSDPTIAPSATARKSLTFVDLTPVFARTGVSSPQVAISRMNDAIATSGFSTPKRSLRASPMATTFQDRAEVRESVSAATPQASTQVVELSCAAENVPTVKGDPGRLGQLLDNLISNAVKFTPDGGRVHVRVFPENGDVAIEVADNGIGIPVAEQAQLFQKFFRSSEAGKRAIQGTGLGLSISKAIVEAHSGRVELESEETIGTTVRVLLPVAGKGSHQIGAA